MHYLIKLALFLALIFAQDVVPADTVLPGTFKALGIRNDDESYLNIVQGLFRSEKGNILQYIGEISCDEIQTLENDAKKAKKFVTQLQNGQVPTIIENLPDEGIEQFKDIVNIAFSLPSQILTVAQAAVTDAAKIINDIEDGAIIQDIESLTGVALSEVTGAWADFTDGLTDAWGDATSEIGCFFTACPVPTVGACRAAANSAGAAATTTNDAAVGTQIATQSTTQSGAQSTGITSSASTQSSWAIGISFTTAVGIFACAIYL